MGGMGYGGGGWGIRGGGGLRGYFRETIPACLNFGHQHIFFLYPKKLSYSSRNAYIQKLRARGLGYASCLLEDLKNAKNVLFVTSRPFSE